MRSGVEGAEGLSEDPAFPVFEFEVSRALLRYWFASARGLEIASFSSWTAT